MYNLTPKARFASSVGNGLFNSASLDLHFAKTKSLVDATTGTNLVDFTRASSGTYVGSDGLIKTATTNLLLQSEDFSTTWSPSRAAISVNSQIAPNGTATADTITGDGTAAFPNGVNQSTTAFAATGTKVFSVYAKAGTNSFVQLFTGGNVNIFANFDLTSGVVGTIGSESSAAIAPVGNGWYRCSISTSETNPSNVNIILVNSGSAVRAELAGSNKSIYLWGAQLEQSSTVGEYIPTTSTINSAPRFDHDPTTGESLGLLVEEQRVNLLLNSGTLATQSVTVAAIAHTLSFTGTGTVTLSGASTDGPLVGTGTGEANRVELTFTPTAGSLTLTVSGTVTNAQLEEGSFPTSYIPTTDSAVTRSADVASISGTNFSSWYRQDEGTVFIEGQSPGSSASYLAFSDNTNSNRILYDTTTTGVNRRLIVTNGGVAQVSLSHGGAPDEMLKSSFAFKANDFIACTAGSLSAAGTSGTVPTTSLMYIGSNAVGSIPINGLLKRITFWAQRLPDPTLQTITQ